MIKKITASSLLLIMLLFLAGCHLLSSDYEPILYEEGDIFFVSPSAERSPIALGKLDECLGYTDCSNNRSKIWFAANWLDGKPRGIYSCEAKTGKLKCQVIIEQAGEFPYRFEVNEDGTKLIYVCNDECFASYKYGCPSEGNI
ncbi:MAG: hypothetical protein GX683_03050 [Ruminococcaceae bacterium]|nr:hypothetical protein [Oscillospiraceae bacterium]